jgi:hypothetical protein
MAPAFANDIGQQQQHQQQPKEQEEYAKEDYLEYPPAADNNCQQQQRGKVFPENIKISIISNNPWKCSDSPSSSSFPSPMEFQPPFSTPVPEPKTDWRSIYLCTAVIFCCQVQFSLFLNSQFAYMKTVSRKICKN